MSILGKIANEKRLELIIEEIYHFIKYPMKILELGCGDGWFVEQLSSWLKGAEIKGIDINLKKETEILIRSSAYNLPFPDSYFDCVLAIEIIEHLDPKVYKEIKRVLKPNGKMIVTSPKPEWNWLVELLCGIGLADPLVTPHMNVVNPENLPFKLIKKQSLMLIEWFGVFENEK